MYMAFGNDYREQNILHRSVDPKQFKQDLQTKQTKQPTANEARIPYGISNWKQTWKQAKASKQNQANKRKQAKASKQVSKQASKETIMQTSKSKKTNAIKQSIASNQ